MFFRWLLTQVDRDDPIGDLANDAQRDPQAPVNGTTTAWRSYLRRHPGACWQARLALEAAIAEYAPVDN